jgi:CelD/BcsL family acetyltransferase involved in cellulose biosynthesis
MRVNIRPILSFASVEREWRALEATAPDLSFFQSWTWIGTLADERYDDPVLLRAEQDTRTLGLALFNRRRGRLCLAESGDVALDAPFIEHNAPLLGARAGPEVAAALVANAWRVPGVQRVVLSGVPPSVARLAGGVALRRQERLAPFVDLDAIRAAGGDWMASLSANSRYQIRRSMRHYSAQGPLAIERAATREQAEAWLEELIVLHAARWRERGQHGAFATPFLRRFHRTLVGHAMIRDELDLLRASAGPHVLGYLYNFRLRGRVLAYQSGLALAESSSHGRPGLTCHALAIERALASGDRAYDFLAPASRYKTSLAGASAPLVWAELVPSWSMLGLAARLRHVMRSAILAARSDPAGP